MMQNLIILLFLVLIVIGVPTCSTYNDLNRQIHAVSGAESRYGAALDIIPEKIKGVWAMNQQYLDHESKTFKDVAEARNKVLAALKQFEATQGSDVEKKTEAANTARESMVLFKAAQDAALTVTVESHPNLKGDATTTQAMRALEEGTNEIKTALDDWIAAIQTYNTERQSLVGGALANFMPRFPPEIKYYKGKRTKLDMDDLNPQKNK